MQIHNVYVYQIFFENYLHKLLHWVTLWLIQIHLVTNNGLSNTMGIFAYFLVICDDKVMVVMVIKKIMEQLCATMCEHQSKKIRVCQL